MNLKTHAREPLLNPRGSPIYYYGPGLDQGPLPAMIFFALSATASLYQDPFNQPVLHLSQEKIRTFSWDLPFHGAEADPKEAMYKWALEFMRHPHFLEGFMAECQSNIDYLIEQHLIEPSKIVVAGLSRGGFIATHLAAQDDRIPYILGFAPLTRPRPLEEFAHLSLAAYEHLSLSHLAKSLIHKHLRFYIGNHDMRVGTDACFEFIHHLTQTAYQHGIRSPHTELIIYPSVGHRGHGTPPYIFQDGAHWVKTKLLNA